MTTVFVLVTAHVARPAVRHLARLGVAHLPLRGAARRPGERGQASAEYALVLLGVATVALLVSAWAAKTDGIGRLFDAVIDKLVDSVK